MLELHRSFQRDPATFSDRELAGSYRAFAARYRRLAASEERPSIREVLLDLARQCDVDGESH
jgi:hypothetical protein